MRHAAWLSATLQPKAPPPRTHRRPSPPPPPDHDQPVTRHDKLLAEGASIELPDPGDAAYLVAYLFDVGPVASTGMGPAPISYTDILAWQQATGTDLSAWESGMLRRLSRAYCAELAVAADPAVAAPGSRTHETPEQQAERRARVSAGLGSALRMLRDTRPQRG